MVKNEYSFSPNRDSFIPRCGNRPGEITHRHTHTARYRHSQAPARFQGTECWCRASLKPGWKIRTADQRRAGKRERGKEQENSEGEKQDCEGERRARGIFTARTTGGLRDCLMPRLSRSEIRKHLSTQTNFYCAVTERQQTAVATTGAESDAQACIPAHPSLCDPCGVLHPFLIF